MFGKKRILVFITILLIAILSFAYYLKVNKSGLSKTSVIQTLSIEKKPKVTIGDKDIFVDIAQTDQEKSRGLSEKKSLAENEGMLFIFQVKSTPSFWMKEMLIPIDIIWIADNKVLDIHKNIPAPKTETPISNLPLYTPQKPINFVLEVNAGFVDKNGIDIGDNVIFSNI